MTTTIVRPKIALAAAVALAVLLPGATPLAAQGEPFAGLDQSITTAMRTWKVPGAAVAIVRNDSVIYAKGFGVREIGNAATVDERTIFAIGSSSKAFTAAAVGLMVDDGKVRWDDPATKYLPGFELYDPYATREITVRDLLTHRSGLARGEFLWYRSDFDRAEVLRRIRFLKPTWSFRSQFGYQNVMYLAAGQVAAAAAGTSWDDLVQTRIFKPLGMTSSSTSITALAGATNRATPHIQVSDTVRAIEWQNIDNAAPAGSINSTALDMAQWLRLQLGDGKYQGAQIMKANTLKETHTPQITMRTGGGAANPETYFSTYGLGWMVQDYRGHVVVHHGGAVEGMSAMAAMLPDQKLGLVVLTNMHGTPLTNILMNTIFDLQLGAPAKDWSADVLARTRRGEATRDSVEKQLAAKRVTGTKPSRPLDAYAGSYADSLYGDAQVRVENGRLVFARALLVADLEHWHHDIFRARWRARQLGSSFVTFSLAPDATVSAVAVELAGETTTYRRKRAAQQPASGRVTTR